MRERCRVADLRFFNSDSNARRHVCKSDPRTSIGGRFGGASSPGFAGCDTLSSSCVLSNRDSSPFFVS